MFLMQKVNLFYVYEESIFTFMTAHTRPILDFKQQIALNNILYKDISPIHREYAFNITEHVINQIISLKVE